MNVCRTCLTDSVDKDVSLLSAELEGEPRPYSDIMLFCLGIQVIPESKITSKLCEECFLNILSFHKFKTLAIKSNEYLQSLHKNRDMKDEIVGDDMKQETTIDFSEDMNDDNIHEEPCIKLEIGVKDEECLIESQSDEELLSDIKKIKYEFVTEESKENEPKTTIKKRKLKRKCNKNIEIPEQVCEECGKTVRHLKYHMLQHQPPLMRKKYKCKDCDQLFSNYGSRSRHYKNKHLGIKKHCDQCNKDFVNLAYHQMLVHKSAPLNYECVLCSRRFISKWLRDEHMLIHTKERPHACDQCDKTFRTKIALNYHKRQVHEKERSHLCQVCSKRFFKKSRLQVHLRSHTKEKPYECSECGKFFASTATLRNHKLIHTDVKTFACEQCDMTFTTPGYLRNHMVCHSEEKRHACQYCGVAFRRSDHRRRHERTAHEKHILPAD